MMEEGLDRAGWLGVTLPNLLRAVPVQHAEP